MLPVFSSVTSARRAGASGAAKTVTFCFSPSSSHSNDEKPQPCVTVCHAGRPAGPGVSDQYVFASSSRTKSISPGTSATGSLDHGVRRFSRLLALHELTIPRSLTMQPTRSLASTFVHGSGGRCSPGNTRTSYARPSGVKPP